MGSTIDAAVREIEFPGELTRGDRGAKVRRLQEWLCLSGFGTAVDGSYGPATDAQRRAFAAHENLGDRPALTRSCWDALCGPLVRAIAVVANNSAKSFPAATLRAARQHLKEHPAEIGGMNRGPWVRAYTDGRDGDEYLWCASFVTFVLAQSARDIGSASPLIRTYGCDELALDARAKGLFVPGSQVASGQVPWRSLGSCFLFLVRKSADDWTHVGFGFAGDGDVFDTIEGNTNDSGEREGYEVCKRKRSVFKKDFIRLS
jgi:hypothetical protein